MANGQVKKTRDWKKYGKTVATVVVTLVVLYVGKVCYDYVYKKGFEAGSHNQLVCAASEKDSSLKVLCK